MVNVTRLILISFMLILASYFNNSYAFTIYANVSGSMANITASKICEAWQRINLRNNKTSESCSVTPLSDSITALRMLNKQPNNFAIIQKDLLVRIQQSVASLGKYKFLTNVKVVSSFPSKTLLVVVNKNSDINSMTDIKGKDIITVNEKSYSYLFAKIILSSLRIANIEESIKTMPNEEKALMQVCKNKDAVLIDMTNTNNSMLNYFIKSCNLKLLSISNNSYIKNYPGISQVTINNILSDGKNIQSIELNNILITGRNSNKLPAMKTLLINYEKETVGQ